MTHKEQFKAEVEKVKLIIQSNRAQGAFTEGYLIGQESVLEHFENFVNSLQEEPVSEDLKEAANNYAVTVYNNYLDNPKAFENIDADTLNEDAFKAGAKWQEQQLMASGTDVTVHVDAGGYPYIPQMELYDYDKDIPLAKEGDKYKVVLIKEE